VRVRVLVLVLVLVLASPLHFSTYLLLFHF
jgi:hypothetical protein